MFLYIEQDGHDKRAFPCVKVYRKGVIRHLIGLYFAVLTHDRAVCVSEGERDGRIALFLKIRVCKIRNDVPVIAVFIGKFADERILRKAGKAGK